MIDDKTKDEIAKAVVRELNQQELSHGPSCRLFTRDEAQGLREFVAHWHSNREDYHNLVQIGRSWADTKKRLWFSIVGIAIIFVLGAVANALFEKIQRLWN